MKKGEKAALWVIAAVLACVLVLTIYLEAQRQHVSRAAMTMMSSGQTASSAADDAAMRLIPTGMNPDELPEPDSRGASALATYCVQCHDLPVPGMHTADEWQTVLNRMDQNIRQRRGMMARVAMPSEQAWATLRLYLVAHAQKPLDTAHTTDIDSPAGQAFQSTCSQCHATPDPAQHTATEWPRVVVRMKSNMNKAGKNVPDDRATGLIVGYLQSHSR